MPPKKPSKSRRAAAGIMSQKTLTTKQITEFALGIEKHVIPKIRAIGLRKENGALRLRLKGVL